MAWEALDVIDKRRLDKPWARYIAEGGQSIVTSTNTQVQYVYEEFASSYVTPGGTNNSYFTLQPGLWLVIASLRLGGTPTNTLVLDLGTGTTVSTVNTNNLAGGVGQVQSRRFLNLAVETSIWAKVWQSSGTSRTVATYGSATAIKMVRLAAYS